MSVIDGSGPFPGGSGGPRRERRPGASVTLRAGGRQGPSVADMMDPAAKSLAEALKITYRLLLASMVIIVAIYLLSGLQSVKEAERGILLNFGKISGQDLPSGFHWSLPRPIGEILHISTGEVQVDLTKDFFPNLTKDDEDKLAKDGYTALSNGGSNVLDPDADGMLITGDGNIVHARLKVSYRRERPSETVRHLADDPDAKPEEQVERRLVIAAVKRGMINATANVTLDEFLKNQPDPGRETLFHPVESAARTLAQHALDEVESGIQLQQLNVLIRMPPRHTIAEFNQVQAAQSQKSKLVQEAESGRRESMNTTAGESADLLVSQIDAYEHALAAKKDAEAAKILDTIHAIMMHRPATIDGQPVNPKVFGSVAKLITDAEQYRTQVVTGAKADATLFAAKLKSYRANPYVFVANEWSDAIGTLMSRDNVQVMQIPSSLDRTIVMINRDPDIAKTQEENRKQKEAEAANKERLLKRAEDQLKAKFTGTGD